MPEPHSFARTFTADFADFADGKVVIRAISAIRGSSSWFRLPALGVLRLFAAIQPKCLSMNHLHAKTRDLQSMPIKVIQGNSRYFFSPQPQPWT
jgi:hypothetical protein